MAVVQNPVCIWLGMKQRHEKGITIIGKGSNTPHFWTFTPPFLSTFPFQKLCHIPYPYQHPTSSPPIHLQQPIHIPHHTHLTHPSFICLIPKCIYIIDGRGDSSSLLKNHPPFSPNPQQFWYYQLPLKSILTRKNFRNS